MNKKFIIIFGTIFLLLIIIVGGITYYNEKGKNMMEEDRQKEIEFFRPPTPLEDESYLIWCRNLLNNEEYDCSDKTNFNSEEIMGVSVNLAKLPIIYDDPYFFCYETDLERDQEEGQKRKCLPFPSSKLGNFLLISKDEELIFTSSEMITLIKIMIYPNNDFDDDEAITIIDLKGKILL